MENTILLVLLVSACSIYGCHSAVITVKNNCQATIWPATLTGSGTAPLTGFELSPGATRDLNVAAPWSGRVWARYECSTSGKFTCASGDCNSGQVECNGAGAQPPASLAEFTIGGSNGKDTYDISLVDGFNKPVSISADSCQTTSCAANINDQCPDQLAARDSGGAIVGCKSACVAFGQPQYCCTGAYNTPQTCKPSNYSEIFKKLCPQAYSYAYDDSSSTFTCSTGKNYLVTFCP